MQAVIPAAGRGTRLGELTADRPKPLVEVGGEPLITHAFDAAIDAGVEELIVVIGHLGDRIRRRVGTSYRGRPVSYVCQPEPRGLADAVAQAAPRVAGPFLVVNGDNVVLAPLGEVVRTVTAGGADGALLVEHAGRSEAARTGVVETRDGRVTRVIEKPSQPPSTTITTGVYLLPQAAVHACRLVEPADCGEVDLADAVSLLVSAGYRLAAVFTDAARVNVNTPADVDRAERILADRA